MATNMAQNSKELSFFHHFFTVTPIVSRSLMHSSSMGSVIFVGRGTIIPGMSFILVSFIHSQSNVMKKYFEEHLLSNDIIVKVY